MGRRNRRRIDEERPLSPGISSRRREGDYVVQSITGSASGKTYICPGCNQRIASGVPHIVAWSDLAGPQTRRHWHTPCWNRGRRAV